MVHRWVTVHYQRNIIPVYDAVGQSYGALFNNNNKSEVYAQSRMLSVIYYIYTESRKTPKYYFVLLRFM